MSIRPPFTLETATHKVKMAQNLWNTRDPAKVVLAYTKDSVWRNRDEFLVGRAEIEQFLEKKWKREKQYRLRKEMFCFKDNLIAVEFWYEYFDEQRECWKRTYGMEHWVFDEEGQMASRQMSGNEIEISEQERWFKTDQDVEKGEIPIGHISAKLPL